MLLQCYVYYIVRSQYKKTDNLSVLVIFQFYFSIFLSLFGTIRAIYRLFKYNLFKRGLRRAFNFAAIFSVLGLSYGTAANQFGHEISNLDIMTQMWQSVDGGLVRNTVQSVNGFDMTIANGGGCNCDWCCCDLCCCDCCGEFIDLICCICCICYEILVCCGGIIKG